MHHACIQTQYRDQDTGVRGCGETPLALRIEVELRPDLAASAGYSLSTGRVLAPTTYDFVENQTVSGNNASVGVSLPLFSGLRNHDNLQRAKLDLHSSLLAEETIRDAEQVVAELRIHAKIKI